MPNFALNEFRAIPEPASPDNEILLKTPLPPDFDTHLLEFVRQVYISRSQNAGLIQENLQHTEQVMEKAMEIANYLIKNPEKENLQTVFDEMQKAGLPLLSLNHLRAMAALHDLAKFNPDGQIDTFSHHLQKNLKAILNDPKTTIKIDGQNISIKEYLFSQGFTAEDIQLLIEEIERHSYATAFIRKAEITKAHKLTQPAEYNEQGEEKTKPEPIPHPSGRGTLESAILSDADLINQTKLGEGFKKIITIRLSFKNFRIADQVSEKQEEKPEDHDIMKTIESARRSAEEAVSQMHFQVTQSEAKANLKIIKEFIHSFKEKNLAFHINKMNTYSEKIEFLANEITKFLKSKNLL